MTATLKLRDENGNVYEIPALVGKKGDKGDTGATGEQGPQGNDGYTPIKGTDYFDGTNGTNGTDGTDGTNGTSAYAAALSGGYSDTEANFNADLAAIQSLASVLGAI